MAGLGLPSQWNGDVLLLLAMGEVLSQKSCSVLKLSHLPFYPVKSLRKGLSPNSSGHAASHSKAQTEPDTTAQA